jgi:hypothetical protein
LKHFLEAKEMGNEQPALVNLDVYVGEVIGDIDVED